MTLERVTPTTTKMSDQNAETKWDINMMNKLDKAPVMVNVKTFAGNYSQQTFSVRLDTRPMLASKHLLSIIVIIAMIMVIWWPALTQCQPNTKCLLTCISPVSRLTLDVCWLVLALYHI